MLAIVAIYHQIKKVTKLLSLTPVSRLACTRPGTSVASSTVSRAKLTLKLTVGSQISASGGGKQMDLVKDATEKPEVSISGLI